MKMTSNEGWPEAFGFRIEGNVPCYIVAVSDKSLAQQAGLQPGDQIVELDGHDVTMMSREGIMALAKHCEQVPPSLGVISRIRHLELVPDLKGNYGVLFRGTGPVYVQGVAKSSPAVHVGLKPGDMLLEINGVSIRHMDAANRMIRNGRDVLRLAIIPGQGGKQGVSAPPAVMQSPREPGTRSDRSIRKHNKAVNFFTKVNVVLEEDPERKEELMQLLRDYATDKNVETFGTALAFLLTKPAHRKLLSDIRIFVPQRHRGRFDYLVSQDMLTLRREVIRELEQRGRDNKPSWDSSTVSSRGSSRGSSRPSILPSPQKERKLSWKTRTVVVEKGQASFGFVLRGHSPVYIESIEPGSASDRAGLKVGDHLLRLNGLDVSSATHKKVITLLQGSGSKPTLVVGVKKGQERKSSDDRKSISSASSLPARLSSGNRSPSVLSLSSVTSSLSSQQVTEIVRDGRTFKQQMEHLLTPSEKHQIKASLKRYKDTRNADRLIQEVYPVLDTPAKEKLWGYIIRLLPTEEQHVFSSKVLTVKTSQIPDKHDTNEDENGYSDQADDDSHASESIHFNTTDDDSFSHIEEAADLLVNKSLDLPIERSEGDGTSMQGSPAHKKLGPVQSEKTNSVDMDKPNQSLSGGVTAIEANQEESRPNHFVERDEQATEYRRPYETDKYGHGLDQQHPNRGHDDDDNVFVRGNGTDHYRDRGVYSDHANRTVDGPDQQQKRYGHRRQSSEPIQYYENGIQHLPERGGSFRRSNHSHRREASMDFGYDRKDRPNHYDDRERQDHVGYRHPDGLDYYDDRVGQDSYRHRQYDGSDHYQDRGGQVDYRYSNGPDNYQSRGDDYNDRYIQPDRPEYYQDGHDQYDPPYGQQNGPVYHDDSGYQDDYRQHNGTDYYESRGDQDQRYRQYNGVDQYSNRGDEDDYRYRRQGGSDYYEDRGDQDYYDDRQPRRTDYYEERGGQDHYGYRSEGQYGYDDDHYPGDIPPPPPGPAPQFTRQPQPLYPPEEMTAEAMMSRLALAGSDLNKADDQNQGITQGYQPSVTPGYQPSVTPGYQPSVTPGYQQGVTPGYHQGITPGYQPGVTPGYQQGVIPEHQQGITPGYQQDARPAYQQGITPGYQEGITPEYQQGILPGYQQGITPGYQQGITPGYQQGVTPGYQGEVPVQQNIPDPGVAHGPPLHRPTESVSSSDVQYDTTLGESTSSIPLPPPPPPSPLDLNASTSSIPMPPPLPPGKAPGPRMNMNVKRMNWEKLEGEKVKNTIWGQIGGDEYLQEVVKVMELEHRFSMKTKDNSDEEDDFDAPVAQKKKKVVTILPHKKAYNIAIVLGHLKMSHAEIRQAVLQMDDSRVSPSHLKQLLVYAAEDEEIEKFEKYIGVLSALNESDRFAYEMNKIPGYKTRLKAMIFKANFAEKTEELRQHIDAISRASWELKNSQKLAKILQLVLAMGNYLNEGNIRVAKASGFRVSFLRELDTTKTSDKKSTFLHILANAVSTNFSQYLAFSKELPTVPLAAKVSNWLVEQDLLELESVLVEISETAKMLAAEPTNDPKDKFVEVMGAFMDKAADEIQTLRAQYSESMKEFVAVAEYYGEDPKLINSELLFTIFADFMRKFDKAHYENITPIKKKGAS
ncbi:delphilin-like isoform X3 [Branchiostoma floridae]|uniref:Delphilin-like isoform X3 n=1 Tax=Branchiostoma floridae TaxID=7739 RepID=A0A9J7MAC6_BRAFL|nr:delphilin-like isoform X3 [Branchiostoma floridae]